MKACASVSLVGASLILVAGFVGCGGASQESAPAATPAAPAESAPAEAPAAADPTTPVAASPAASAEPPAPSGGTAPADPKGEETRTLAVIAEAIKAHRKEARECYEKGLKEVPGLKGDVVISFTLKPSGEVKAAEVNRDRSTITQAMVTTCVIDVVRKIQFPKSSRGMETTGNYPFNFNP